MSLLNTLIPKNRFWIADYPNLDPNAEGRVIPRLYGEKDNISPTPINMATGLYKILCHEMKAINWVRAGEETLTLGVDFLQDLPNAEITLLTCPRVTAGVTYYFTIEADYAISGVNHQQLCRITAPDYGDGEAFEINGVGAWTPQAYDIAFCLWGRQNLSDSDARLITADDWNWSGWNRIGLRDHLDRSRLAQSFRLPAGYGGDWYITQLAVAFYKIGAPVGDIYCTILSAYNPAEVQIGGQSHRFGGRDCAYILDDFERAPFPLRDAAESNILVSAQGRMLPDSGNPLMTNIADVLEDVLVEEIGVPEEALNDGAFDDLRAAKTEEVCAYLDTEQKFQDFLEKAEVGQMFKVIPGLDRRFAPRHFAVGEPPGTIHLRDEDFVSFRMYRDLDMVKQIYRCKYDEDLLSNSWPVRERQSAYAKFFYGNEETFEYEAYLKEPAEVDAILADYEATLKEPPVVVVFEVKGHGFDHLPMDKVKLTRSRAMFVNGRLEGVLFRIFRIEKKLSSKITEITALLDSQVSS